MFKKILVSLSLIGLIIFSSCSNLIEPKTDTDISFTLGDRAAAEISKAAVTKDSEFIITCTFEGIKLPAKTVTVTKATLANAKITLENIPFNEEFKILLDVSYNGHVIYEGESNPITLNQDNDGLGVNIKINKRKGKISYNKNEGTTVEKEQPVVFVEEYFIDTATFTLPEMEKEGCIWGGWYLDKECTKAVKELGQNNYLGDVTLYAKFIPIKYNITYSNNGIPAEYEPDYSGYINEYTVESKTITLPEPTVEGYKFDCWLKGPDFATTVKEISKGSMGDIELQAKWTDVAPNPVTNLSATVSDNTIAISWNNPKDVDFDKVLITCENTTISKTLTDKSESTYIYLSDKDWNKGTYKFKVIAQDKSTKQSDATFETLLLPTFTSSSMPNWLSNSSGVKGAKCIITGENFNTEGLVYTCNMFKGSQSYKDPSVQVVSASELQIQCDIPAEDGKYTIHVSYLGGSFTFKFDVGYLAEGDTVISDGSVISKDKIGTYELPTGKVAVAVIYKPEHRNNGTGKVDQKAYGVCLKEAKKQNGNPESYVWTINNYALGTNTNDGSTNWSNIVAKLEENKASKLATDKTQFPMFINYANVYGTISLSGLSGTDFSTGWYIPSKDELNVLLDSKAAITEAVTANVCEDLVSTYWSSSQATTGMGGTCWAQDTPSELHPTTDPNEKEKNIQYRARCIRRF